MGSPAAPLVGLHADLDGSGTLSRAEVWAHLSQHSSWTSERVDHLVKALDRDGSGEIPVGGWDAVIALLEQPSSSQSCARPSPATPQPSPPPPGSGSTHCTDGEPHCAAPPPSAVLRRSVSLQVRQEEKEEAAPERPSSGFFRAAPWVPKPGRPPRDNAMFIRADSCAASGPGGAPGSREKLPLTLPRSTTYVKLAVWRRVRSAGRTKSARSRQAEVGAARSGPRWTASRPLACRISFQPMAVTCVRVPKESVPKESARP
eukprot:scaffold38176_cov66-Phaeocystis_antarctica.AAC.2